MAPATTQQVLLSPAELSYLHTSLSNTPPIRPDGRSPTQFRPLIAETDILPGTNGSARICFADGTEAIVGVKAEVEKSRPSYQSAEDGDRELDREEDEERGLNEWVELTVEIPGFRDDDSMPVFLAAMMSEALLADGEFTKRLWINRRFHWKLYLDVRALPFFMRISANLGVDFITFAASVISATITVSYYTSCATFNEITQTQVREGRGSFI